MSSRKLLVQAAAGAEPEVTNIEDVFSTYLFTGIETNFQNGINLADYGGMVWFKKRRHDPTTIYADHKVFDTERGTLASLKPNLTDAEENPDTETVSAFNTNGFTCGSDSHINRYGDIVAWTWRKQERFFDVVKYTGPGTGAAYTVNHNLGSAPGLIILKKRTGSQNWGVYHRSIPTKYLILNEQDAAGNGTIIDNVTASSFRITSIGSTWSDADDYVAYLFAHNNGDGVFGPDGGEDIIKCGTYTGNGSSQEINLGFEPQYLLIKNVDESQKDWVILDTMRGMALNDDPLLFCDTSSTEDAGQGDLIRPTPTGFLINTTFDRINKNAVDYVYMAIRRGPMAVPTDASDVFSIDTLDASQPAYDSGHEVDFAIQRQVNTATDNYVSARISPYLMYTNQTAVEATSTYDFDYRNGMSYSGPSTNANDYAWMWKRAPSFCDISMYEGNFSSNHSINHNLNAVPEMIWVKAKDYSQGDWAVYHKDLGSTKFVRLNSTNGEGTSTNYWSSTSPTESVFTVGQQNNTNNSGNNFIAYLFASISGVSKIGSYTGTGSALTVNCGFSSGARFVIIKRTDDVGDWFVFDTERGIVTGNDPYIKLNNTTVQASSDLIDPVSSGFSVTSSLPAINTSGGSYIFYAIA